MRLHGRSHKALAPSLVLGAVVCQGRGGPGREEGALTPIAPLRCTLKGSWAELATAGMSWLVAFPQGEKGCLGIKACSHHAEAAGPRGREHLRTARLSAHRAPSATSLRWDARIWVCFAAWACTRAGRPCVKLPFLSTAVFPGAS